MSYTLVVRIWELFINMIVAEVLCQQLFYGGSVIISVDDDKLEGHAHDIDDIVDEPSGFVAFHTVNISSDVDPSVPCFRNAYAVQFLLC